MTSLASALATIAAAGSLSDEEFAELLASIPPSWSLVMALSPEQKRHAATLRKREERRREREKVVALVTLEITSKDVERLIDEGLIDEVASRDNERLAAVILDLHRSTMRRKISVTL